ncbi:metallo-mystery pair system four-Cys motif protein [Shewanella corallii]|uniref:Metallo-mystery pair system four-Cys motif protein n=1 Tax=Shewanella corallii TaxID=560080 RepID=A0ABT0N3N2_9GAMM|nr:MbnP family copper-binding protein [Shewanella corallii]MCL2912382.1 metallo-mystery pair system four-Cys motif protein [Shewanella corallii]
MQLRIIAAIAMPLILVACQPTPTQLELVPVWRGAPIACGDTIGGMSASQSQWQLAQLQLYLSEFKLNNQALALQSTAHQQTDVALLGSDCGGEGYWTLSFTDTIDNGDLSFTLGVPFSLNHLNPLKADSPLNQSDMFWTWQLGYKFLRLDITRTPDELNPQTGWSFHLGSAGCESPSPMRPPSVPCTAENRFRYQLAYSGQPQLTLELSELLPADITANLDYQESCMSEPGSKACAPLLSQLESAQRSVQPLWSLQQAEPQHNNTGNLKESSGQ